jgi:hypothetical protein
MAESLLMASPRDAGTIFHGVGGVTAVLKRRAIEVLYHIIIAFASGFGGLSQSILLRWYISYLRDDGTTHLRHE